MTAEGGHPERSEGSDAHVNSLDPRQIPRRYAPRDGAAGLRPLGARYNASATAVAAEMPAFTPNGSASGETFPSSSPATIRISVEATMSRTARAPSSTSASRHLPLVVALRNDSLVAAALPAPDAAPRAAYAAAAAEELVSARDEALGRMRQAGVDVLDVTPQARAATVINRYLEIKARGAL